MRNNFEGIIKFLKTLLLAKDQTVFFFKFLSNEALLDTNVAQW